MAESGARAALVKEKLLVDRAGVFRQVVERSSRVLKLDEGGNLHPQVDPSRFGTKQKIELLLLARYLAFTGGLAEKPTLSPEEITAHFGLKIAEFQKRIHDLKQGGKVVEAEAREYRLTEGRIGEVLTDLGAE